MRILDMGRKLIGGQIVKVRMPDWMVERLDAMGVVRSDFARIAVGEKLAGGALPITAADVRRAEAAMLAPNALLADLPMKPAEDGDRRYEARTVLPMTRKKFDAIHAELSAVMTPAELDGVGGAPDMPPDAEKNSFECSADQKVILSALRAKSRTSRDLEKRLGWLGLRYSNAEKVLLGCGMIAVVGGMMVAT